jgi:hypothetical protein
MSLHSDPIENFPALLLHVQEAAQESEGTRDRPREAPVTPSSALFSKLGVYWCDSRAGVTATDPSSVCGHSRSGLVRASKRGAMVTRPQEDGRGGDNTELVGVDCHKGF